MVRPRLVGNELPTLQVASWAGLRIQLGNRLALDGDAAFIAFAENEGIEYELNIASRGEHVHEKVLHIQNVNGYIRRFRQWLDPFNGVATKYLPSYVGWRRWLEQSGPSPTAQACLAAAIG